MGLSVTVPDLPPQSGGQAAYATNALAGGAHAILAQYSGDSNWPSASATYGQRVNAPTTLSLAAGPAGPVYGQTLMLTASVSATVPPGFAAPTGQVTFSLQGGGIIPSLTPLGTATLTSGTAALGGVTLPVGTQTILAQYGGDSTWNAASGSATVTVSQASTSVLASLMIVSGQLTLTAVVAPLAPGAGTPTGQVQFVNTASNAVLASVALAGGKASAAVPANVAMTVMAQPIAAAYSGDGNFKGSVSAPLPAVTNAAANLGAAFAPDEIVSLFGILGLNGNTAATPPLTTSLAGVTVNVTDSAGMSRVAQLYGVFASDGQVNLIVPSGTAAGLALVTVALPGGGTATTVIEIANSAPGIFTANMTGQGVYAGQVVYEQANGSQTVGNPAALNPLTNQYATSAVSVNTPGQQVYLVLYGTGLRHAGVVTATVNGVSVPVTYFGAQGDYAGLDQINLGPLPTSLAGAGIVNLVISADGHAANAVTVAFQ